MQDVVRAGERVETWTWWGVLLWLKASLLRLKDEECIRPGPASDLSFLEKLEEKVGKHAHFQT